MKNILCCFIFFLGFQVLHAQKITRKDSLQGGLRPERTCYDVKRYDLNIQLDIERKSLSGSNTISFKVLENTSKIQVDLFANMQIDSIFFRSQKLVYKKDYKRDYNAVFINLPELVAGADEKIVFYYSGIPVIAKNAPWDGGFVYSSDKQGKPWVGVACQGTGASLWWPCKDSQSDEPDLGMSVKVAVPNGLMNVSNGRLTGSQDLKNGYTRWDWEVKNPINTYDVTINVADYAHIKDQLNGLSIDYYVLKENEQKAKKHFEEVKPMLNCFQSKFGPYPFAEDGYKLVETYYLGMEHQSAVAYGNKYMKGYLGRDLSSTGAGLLFDFITIHESGHEWFGNSITSKDIADMWIHEGFTQYTEAVYLECQFGYEKSLQYLNGLKNNVENDRPVIGVYGVNREGSGDMYPKGALLLHTLRHIINNDELWWKILYKYATTYRHQIIDTPTVVSFFNAETKTDLSPVFDQYLRHKNIPVLELKSSNGKLEYRWKADVVNFNMPVDIKTEGRQIRIIPTTTWTKSDIKSDNRTPVEALTGKFFINVNLL